MKQSKYLLSTALATAMVMVLASFHSADAQQEYVSKAKAQTLHKAPLPGVEGKEVIIKHFAAPAGFVGGRHFHPGPVYLYMLEGELTVETEGGTETFKAGQLYVEPPNLVMQGRNLSASDDLELLVFQVGDIGKPMMIKAD